MNQDPHSLTKQHSDLLRALMDKQENEAYGTIIKEWKQTTMVEYDAGLQRSFIGIYNQKKTENKYKKVWIPILEALLNSNLITSKTLLWKLKLPNLEKIYSIVELMQKQRQTYDNLSQIFFKKIGESLNKKSFETLQQNTIKELNKIVDEQEKRIFTQAINKLSSLYEQLQPRSRNPSPRQRNASNPRINQNQKQDVRSSSPAQFDQQYLGKSVEEVLLDIYKNQRQDDTSLIQTQIQKVVKLLEAIDFCSFGLKYLDYQLFGSQLNGFGTKSSDIDLSLLTSSYVDERKFLRRVYLQLFPQTKKISHAKSHFVDNARIPLINVQIDGVQVDICANNILGVINTQLLKAYADLHPKIPQLGILLKTWGKKKDVVSKSKLSSYTIILMLLFFLQKQFDLPYLQNQEEKQILKIKRNFYREEDEVHEFDTDVYFVQDKSDILRMMRKAKDKLDSTSLIDILKMFWDFYSRQGYYFSDQRPIISISKQHETLKRDVDKFDRFVVIDPFDLLHNPGDKADRCLSEIKQKFADARDYCLSRQDSIWKLFV